jgi:transketolase
VTESPRSGSLWAAYSSTLVELGELDRKVIAYSVGSEGVSATSAFRDRFPSRYFVSPSEAVEAIPNAAGHAQGGHCVYLSSSAEFVAAMAYAAVRDSLSAPQANVKIVASVGGSSGTVARGTAPFLEDIGIMRGLPGLTVIAPADAPSTRSAVLAIHQHVGPAYVRLAGGDLPIVTDGAFEVGRAVELRAGGDLTIVAVGALVASALAVAQILADVGISTRVLDFASIKPFDEPSILRAARDTGAILVLEEHSVLTGVGALVASTTSENYPVPVRRVGVPDLLVGSDGRPGDLDRYGLGLQRIRDEAWELLRLRGKVT